MAVVEVCVETVDEALAAEAGGAARVELCADLAAGGVTPGERLIADCVACLAIPVFVMIRPRPGAFVYGPHEIAAIHSQARRARRLGAGGIVSGVLTSAAAIDETAMQALVAAADPLPVTFHRAFDDAADPFVALERLVSLGVARVLTSGGRPTALDGGRNIARAVAHARGRIIVMAGGRVRAANVRAIVDATGVTEVHAHLTTKQSVASLVSRARH